MRRPTIFEFLNKQPSLTGQKVRLRPRRIEDASDEYRWRTDEELCSHDAGTPVEFTFAEFQERFSIELDYPGLTCTLAIDTLENKHIGECSLFNLDFLKASVEIGIIIGEKSYWERGYGTDAVSTFVAYIFETSDVEKIMLRTLEWNVRAQKCFEKCGFKRCGSATRDHYNFILMEIDRQRDPKTAQ